MADYKLTPLEKETIILWNEEEDKVCIDTFNSKLISRLKKAKKITRNTIELIPRTTMVVFMQKFQRNYFGLRSLLL